MVTTPLESRLGWFVPLSEAWGRASEPVQAQVTAASRAYHEGYITADTWVQRVRDLLGLALPESFTRPG